MILFSLSNKASAKLLATSVLPTPVGPKNKNDPIGLFWSFIPALWRKIASLTNSTASSWPITRRFKVSAKCSTFSRSPFIILEIGMLVFLEIILAIISSVTTSDNKLSFFSEFSRVSKRFSNSGISLYFNSEALL